MAEPNPNPTAPDGGNKASWTPILLAVTFVLVVVISLPTVILLLFAMMPAIVAFIIDRTPQKYSVYCVGGINFCGVYPFLTDLWTGQHTVAAAVDTLTDVFSLLLIYSAAALGWMIYIAVPPLVGAVLTVMNQRRVTQLKDIQRDLIKEWGDEVASHLEEPEPEPQEPQETSDDQVPA
ncbi:MAG: acyl-CoA synthetase [Rhodospirillales bacterium]|jgi:hypothetical protein|nr:acyl-CoA synthetase [Rhodospirillales bacterium]